MRETKAAILAAIDEADRGLTLAELYGAARGARGCISLAGVVGGMLAARELDVVDQNESAPRYCRPRASE